MQGLIPFPSKPRFYCVTNPTKGVMKLWQFSVWEKNKGYTVMSNHHLRNKELSLKARGLLSQMLSLPEDWDYTLAGLSLINRESIDAIRTAVWELEKAGYITRRARDRDEKGKMTAIEYTHLTNSHSPQHWIVRYWKIQQRISRYWKIRHRITRRRKIQRN